jgi:hypothetical protein
VKSVGWLGRALDRWQDKQRAREIAEDPRLEWRPDARERLEEAGLQSHWRVQRGKAHGQTLDGEPVVLPEDEFVERFFVQARE